MHPRSETDLRKLAGECLRKEGTDAWPIYRDEAMALYSAEDDGPRDSYIADATAIFSNTNGALFPETPIELLTSLRQQYPNDSEAELRKRFVKEGRKHPHIVDAIFDDVANHLWKHKIAN